MAGDSIAELILDSKGQVLDGEVTEFVSCLMNGAQLVFRAASDAAEVEKNAAGLHGMETLVESYACRSFLVVPRRGYFAGIIGPLYCASQVAESYFPLFWNSCPIYYYQAGDSGNHQSVRHFFTHPDWPPRPSRTGSYNPLMWLARPIYEEVLHVDDQGRVLLSGADKIGQAVLDGRRQQVLIKNLYADVVVGGLTDDYWAGFELSLVQYYPGRNAATAQILDTMLMQVQIPLSLENCNDHSLLISSTGHVSHVIRTGHRAETFETTFQGQPAVLAREMRSHFTEGELRRPKEMRWFVEK